MASYTNIIKNGNADFSGNWEDVQSYTNVKLTINSPNEGNVRLLWSNGQRGSDIDEHIIATTDVCYNTPYQAYTFMRDHRARWFKLNYTTNGDHDDDLNVECLYLNTPTGIKITDNSAGVVDVSGSGSFNVALAGATGDMVSTTDHMTLGEESNALFIHPVDENNISLLTVSSEEIFKGSSLGVALRDNSAANLTSLNHLGENVNALLLHTSDVCGHSQAATEEVIGATVSGRAMYMAMEVDSTFTSGIREDDTDQSNSLYVALVDGSGNLINRENPLWVNSFGNESITYSYNFNQGIDAQRVTLPALTNPTVLQSVYAYNNGGITVWLNLYDSDVNDNSEPVFSVPVPPGARDLPISKGMQFNNGVVFNSYIAPYDPDAEEQYGPGENVLFVFGTYNLGTIFIDGNIVTASTAETTVEFGGY